MAVINKRNKWKKRYLITSGVVLGVILCIALSLSFIDKTIHLRSDSPAVEFVTDEDTVACVNIDGRFPYRHIIATLDKDIGRDKNGKIAEETRTYKLEAAFSLFLQGSMHIDIETSDEIAYTYILVFSDKTITITDGKVID